MKCNSHNIWVRSAKYSFNLLTSFIVNIHEVRVTWIHVLSWKWVLKARCCLALLEAVLCTFQRQTWSRAKAAGAGLISALAFWSSCHESGWHFQTWISCRNMSWIGNKCVVQVKCYCHCIPCLSADVCLGCAGSLPPLGLLGPLAGKEESRRLVPDHSGSLRWWCSCQCAQVPPSLSAFRGLAWCPQELECWDKHWTLAYGQPL